MPKALVADDRETIRMMLKDHLAAVCGAGVEIVEAPTASEALAAFEAGNFDFTFLDGVFSDGTPMVDVLEKMLQTRPGARVIVTSALPVDDPEVTEAMGVGAYAYLAKPIQRGELAALMKRMEHDDSRIERMR